MLYLTDMASLAEIFEKSLLITDTTNENPSSHEVIWQNLK